MKKELPIHEFLESPMYNELHTNLISELNNNNVMFNTGIRIGDKFIKVRNNLIDHNSLHETFKKDSVEKDFVKNMKRKYKSKAFNLVHKNNEERNELIKQFVLYSTNDRMPNWNLKVIIN